MLILRERQSLRRTKQVLKSEESAVNTHLVFNEIEAAEKARLQSYWEKKLPRLTKLLSPYGADLMEIRLYCQSSRAGLSGLRIRGSGRYPSAHRDPGG